MRKRSTGPPSRRLIEVVLMHDPRERGPYKYTVDVLALPGCFSEGRTPAEALENVKEAIALMLTVRKERRRRDTGNPIRSPVSLRVLRRRGFKVARQGRKHVILARGDTLIPVPRHPGDLARGTFHKILKEAGLSPEDYRRLR